MDAFAAACASLAWRDGLLSERVPPPFSPFLSLDDLVARHSAPALVLGDANPLAFWRAPHTPCPPDPRAILRAVAALPPGAALYLSWSALPPAPGAWSAALRAAASRRVALYLDVADPPAATRARQLSRMAVFAGIPGAVHGVVHATLPGAVRLVPLPLPLPAAPLRPAALAAAYDARSRAFAFRAAPCPPPPVLTADPPRLADRHALRLAQELLAGAAFAAACRALRGEGLPVVAAQPTLLFPAGLPRPVATPQDLLAACAEAPAVVARPGAEGTLEAPSGAVAELAARWRAAFGDAVLLRGACVRLDAAREQLVVLRWRADWSSLLLGMSLGN